MNINPLASIGQGVIRVSISIGILARFSARVFGAMVTPPFYFKVLLRQFLEIGYFSLPVVAMTTLFTGMVLALQAYSGLNHALAAQTIPTLIVLSMFRELSPVLSGLMVAGRIGSAIAAEIGTMKVTEQVDALSTLNVNVLRYLIAPRVLAGILALPLLVIFGDIIGVFGGYIVSTLQLGIPSLEFLQHARESITLKGFISGIVKAAVYGGTITILGTYMGLFSKGGAEGVGQATIQAVVTASILILIENYFLSLLFFGS